jgi:hypothetical protein
MGEIDSGAFDEMENKLKEFQFKDLTPLKIVQKLHERHELDSDTFNRPKEKIKRMFRIHDWGCGATPGLMKRCVYPQLNRSHFCSILVLEQKHLSK